MPFVVSVADDGFVRRVVKFLDTVRGRWLSTDDMEVADLHLWRQRVLSTILFVMLVLGTITAVPSIWLARVEGLWSVMVIDSVALAWVAFLTLSSRLSFRVRTWHLLWILYGLGTWLLVTIGPVSLAYLMAFPILAGLLLGLRPALATLALNAVTLLGVGYALDADFRSERFELHSFAGWVVNSLNFMFMNAVVAIACAVLLQRLEDSFERQRAAAASLEEGGRRLQAANDELAREVAVRTRAEEDMAGAVDRERKLQSRLRQGEKLEAIGTLAGGIAHDFNNILGAILGLAEHARPDASDPVRARLDSIIVACGRARDIVRQMLAFSGQVPPERRVMALGTLIEETVPLLRAALPATIEIRCHAAVDGAVLVNPAEIHQVVMNLAVNAAHAMAGRPSGRLTISLSRFVPDAEFCATHTRLTPGTAYCCLSVSDTGHGIPREHVARIFDPFFTTKTPGDGTGLGLASVHGIVTSLDGDINVYSEVHQGTTFRLYLPAHEAEVPIPAPAPALTAPGPADGGRVLLVDDEPLLLEVTRLFLQRLGYEVIAAPNGEAAWEMFAAHPEAVDILMTDLTMPRMSGADLIRRVRAVRPNLAVVLSSGFGDSLRADELASLSLSGYLQKPYTQRELSAGLRRALDEARRA